MKMSKNKIVKPIGEWVPEVLKDNPDDIIAIRSLKTYIDAIARGDSFSYPEIEFYGPEDLSSESIIKVHGSVLRSGYQAGTNFKAFTCVVTRNTFLNYVRRRRHNKEILNDKTAESVSRQPAVGMFANEEKMLSQEPLALTELASIINSMNEDQREALVLRTLGYRNTDIADIQGVPVGTVGSRLYRAKQNVARKLKIDDNVGEADI